jgi:transposase InsO family protein
MPKVRRDAAHLVAHGWSVRAVGRRYGVGSSTVSKWVKKAKIYGFNPIPTASSRPLVSPHKLSKEKEELIVAKRLELRRSAEVIHRALSDEGVVVSLPSVKRTLDRRGLLKKRSPWKRWHSTFERPDAVHPGALLQADTIHIAIDGRVAFYVFTVIDVHSRWMYARAYQHMNARIALSFVKRAQTVAPFLFDCIQTDNGPEWSTHFTARVQMRHRHSRVRRSNDNAHIERFNRTVQEKCLDTHPRTVHAYNLALKTYVPFYNNHRHHFGLNLDTPLQKLTASASKVLIR